MRRQSWVLAGALTLALVASAPSLASADGLAEAYAREIALLQQERARLLELRAEQQRSQRQVEAQQRESLAAAARELSKLRLRLRQLQDDHDELRRGAEGGESGEALLAATLEQARGGLGMAAPAPDASLEEQLQALFERGLAELGRRSAVRKEPGTYFDTAGRQRRGDIWRIGQVGALGLAPGAEGPLCPVEGDALGLQGERGGELARALAAGERPALVTVCLFDPGARAQPLRPRPGWRATLQAGGALVWPILTLALLALLLATERGLRLLWVRRPAARLLAGVMAAARRGDVGAAQDLCAGSSLAEGRVMAATLAVRQEPLELRDRVLDEALMAEMPRQRRFLGSLQVIAAVAPLMGLLGTVTGMIATFRVITEHGTGDPRMLSGGISEALVTTELGLLVAIPVLLLHAALAALYEARQQRLELHAQQLDNLLARQGQESPPPTPAP